MATNFVAKLWQNYLPHALIAPAFRNGMGYRYLNVRVNSGDDVATSCNKYICYRRWTARRCLTQNRRYRTANGV